MARWILMRCIANTRDYSADPPLAPTGLSISERRTGQRRDGGLLGMATGGEGP